MFVILNGSTVTKFDVSIACKYVSNMNINTISSITKNSTYYTRVCSYEHYDMRPAWSKVNIWL